MRFQDYYATALRQGWFDPCFYFDVLQSKGISMQGTDLSLFEHYATIGWKHGLSPSEHFSVEGYLGRYKDVADRQVDPLYHYLTWGQREQRKSFPVVAPTSEADDDQFWNRSVEDVQGCVPGRGDEDRHIARNGGSLSRQIAEDLCVVIPSYNHQQFILAALDSILAQSLRPKEIRIIDDGSEDGSAELVRSLANEELGIIVDARENKGAPATINQAVAETQCPIIAVLNSDDRWHPLRVEQVIDGLRPDGGADVLFTGLRFVGPRRRCEAKRSWYEQGLADYRNGTPLWLALMFCNFFFTTSNLIARRDKFLELGGFGPLRYFHDLDYMLKALIAGQRVHFLEQTLCEYRVHASNTIDEDMDMLLFEEAWVIAKFLRMSFARISERQRLAVAQRICGKGLGSRVLHILRATARNAEPLDDELFHSRVHFRDIRELSDELSRCVVEPRQILEEMTLLVPQQGAASIQAMQGQPRGFGSSS